MKLTLGVGNVFTAEKDMVISPNKFSTARYACIMVHGVEAAGGAWDWMSASQYRWPVVRSLVDACGLYAVSADMGGSATWGNATLQSRLDAAFAYTQTLPNVKTGKVILIGQSMGGLSAMNWAKNNKSKVAGVVGVIPVTNLTNAWQTGYTSAINSAYGGTYSEAAHGASYNPVTYAAALSGIKGQLWVGASDTLARLADANIIAAASPTIMVKQVAGAHAESTIGNIDLSEMEGFISVNSA